MGISNQHRAHRGRARWTLTTTDRLQREEGSSLIIALAIVLVMSVTLAALLAYANTNFRTESIYRRERLDRYAGDGAIEAAINYVRRTPGLGVDPSNTTPPPCLYNVPTERGLVAVSCAADAGSGSGVPAETGLVPDQAILALGERHNEVGPMNDANNGVCDPFSSGQAEPSIYFRRGEVSGYLEEVSGIGSLVTCTRDRTLANSGNEFQIRGKVVAAGNIQAESGVRVRIQPQVGTDGVAIPGSGAVKRKSGRDCNVTLIPAGCGTATTAELADPGVTNPVAWAHVPIDFSATRDTPTVAGAAYTWNGTGLVQGFTGASCAPKSTIILLPGWYRNAQTLNQFTANRNCRGSTIWLAPDDGADNILMTADDKTGAFYFGFADSNNAGCSNAGSRAHRWCIGNAPDMNVRVVAGTPYGWNPLAAPGTTTARTVTMTTAQTIDDTLSQTWNNGAGAKTIGDGSVARYQADFLSCPLGVCLSSDRGIQLRGYAPQVAEGPDNDNNNIQIRVAHREAGGSVDTPRVNISARSASAGTRNCPGNYSLPTNNTGILRSDALLYNGSASLAAARVAQCLDSADLINGIQIYLRWTGNRFNSGTPQIFLDGADVSFVSTPGAAFPAPANGTNGAASLDCDSRQAAVAAGQLATWKEKAGAQLIFGGDSHVFVADGSLEACAGPYPTQAGDHQQIALYGIPAVAPIRPTGMTVTGSNSVSTSGSNAVSDMGIAEPAGGAARVMTINYSRPTKLFSTGDTYEGRVNLTMPGYTPPAGLRVARVDARVTYDSDNACTVVAEVTACLPLQTNSELRVNGTGGCTRGAPIYGTLRSWATDITGCAGSLASGLSLTWAARATMRCAFTCAGTESSSDKLDGVELLISLEPDGTTTNVPVPQSGCIVAYPNYSAGNGAPDCAIAKAESRFPSGILSDDPDWTGRLSVQGTVYSPSSALEIDDTDAAYSLGSRGIVVRHLRIKGFKLRPGYSAPVIDTQLDRTPANRDVVLTACRRTVTGSNRPCGQEAGDHTLTKARVRFLYRSATDTTPQILWWTDNR